jgi:nucleoid-associated protein YgaU
VPVAVVTSAATSYTVVPGDNLWEIAARHLAQATGRERAALTDGDITAYWARVCDANRDRIQSGDVNLIYAGEVIELPAL